MDLRRIYDLIDAADQLFIGTGDDLCFLNGCIGIVRWILNLFGTAVVRGARSPCGTGPAESIDFDGV